MGACTGCSEQRAGRDKERGVLRTDNEGEGEHGRARERGEGPDGVLTEELQGMAMGSGKRKGVGGMDGAASGPPAMRAVGRWRPAREGVARGRGGDGRSSATGAGDATFGIRRWRRWWGGAWVGDGEVAAGTMSGREGGCPDPDRIVGGESSGGEWGVTG